MGLFDNLKSVLGGKKDSSIASTTRAPSQVLREKGIDPSGLKFAFGADGTVTVTGKIQQEADKTGIKKVLLTLPGIKQVKQELSVASVAAEAVEASARTYTVQPGDTLWKIAKQFYGEGNQYLKIFEANKGLLKDPDHIFPDQELVIPE